MKIDLRIVITEDRYQVESTKIGYQRDDPAMVMSIDNNGMESFLYIGESIENIVSQKGYDEFLEKYGHRNPRFYNPFNEKSFSAVAAHHVIYYYFSDVIRKKRPRIPSYFRAFVIGMLDRANVSIEFKNHLNVPRELLEELMRLLDERLFTNKIKITSGTFSVLSN